MPTANIEPNAQRAFQDNGTAIVENATGAISNAVTANGFTAFALEFLLPADFDISAISSVQLTLAGGAIANPGYTKSELGTPVGSQSIGAIDVFAVGLRAGSRTINSDSGAAANLGSANYTCSGSTQVINLTSMFLAIQSGGALSGDNVVLVMRVIDDYTDYYGGDDYGVVFDGLSDATEPVLTVTYSGRMICETGSFVLTGQAATFMETVSFAAGPGTFTLAGQSATIPLVAKIIAESGAFILEGFEQVYTFARGLVAGSGTFVLSGGLAAIAVPDQSIAADVGTFVLSGGDATFVAGTPFLCETGVFVATGSPAHQSITFPAAKGEFILNGANAVFVVQPYFNAETGSFSLLGPAVSININNSGAAKHLYYHFLVRS